MAREYHLDKNKQKFVLAYGKHAVRGTLVHHETTAVGSDLQVKFMRALGIGEWDGCEKLFYKENESAHEILPANFNFHPGGAVDTQDPLFPTEPLHPGFAYDSVQLPVGLSADNKPENAVGIYRCLKVADYNNAGSQTGFAYSPNFARVAADLIKRSRPDRFTQLIDWGSYVDYRDWCLAQINATVDNQTVQIPRFAAHVFIVPPFNLRDALDKLCQLSCSEWQPYKGKIRFLAPIDRVPEFTFNLAETGENAEDFVFSTPEKENRYKLIRIFYRDIRHPYLQEAEPVVVDRRLDPNEDEKAFELNIGVAEKSQAERLAEFLAKVKIDNQKFIALNGSWNSYAVLPADIVNVTNDIPNWTDKQFQVIEKEEDEERSKGYNYKLQIYPANAYSDTPHTPHITPTVPNTPDRYAPPPAVESLTLSSIRYIQRDDGTIVSSVLGGIVFADFGFAQIAKISWKRPGGVYEEIAERTVVTSSDAEFLVENLPAGVNYFKVKVFSELGVPQTAAEVEQSVTVSANPFTSGQPIFNDTAKVAVADILPSIVSQIVTDAGLNITVRIAIAFATGATHNNTTSVAAVEIDVFNQFGEIVENNLPQASLNQGGVFSLSFPRKYADALEGQSYFRIKVFNGLGWSNAVFLQRIAGTDTKTTSAPTAKVRSNCPLEFSASSATETSLSLSAQFAGTVDLYRRLIEAEDKAWIKHNASAITLPATQGGFNEYTGYELQLRSVANSANRSNIIQTWTRPQSAAPPAKPAPTNPDGNPNASNPTSQLDFYCTSAAFVETEVFVDGSLAATKAAVAVGNLITHSISSLSPSTSKSVKFRHKWGTNDYSVFTQEITRTTEGGSGGTSKPSNGSAVFAPNGDGTGSVTFSWENNGGNGAFTIQKKQGTGGSVTTLTETHTTPLTSFTDFFIGQQSNGYWLYYRVKDNDIGTGESAYTAWIEGAVYIPPYQFGGL